MTEHPAKTLCQKIAELEQATAGSEVRGFLRIELEALLNFNTGPFPRELVLREIERRELRELQRRDTVRYPELQPYFR